MRAILLLGVAILVAIPTASGGAPGLDVAGLGAGMDGLIRAGAPGVVVFARNRGQTVRLAKGLGNQAPRTVMQPTDRFRIGSLTKTYVATVVLQLVGEGKLRLDDPVDRWAPRMVPNGKAMTVRHLLNHTSGLFDYWKDDAFLPRLQTDPAAAWSPRDLIGIGTSHPALFAPGAGWAYSNTNYAVLGLIVEAITRTPLGATLQERLFGPLRLRATTYPMSPRIEGAHAHGYLVLDRPPATDVTAVSPTVAGAAGAIVSTADDVAEFYRTLVSGRLLRPDLLRAMQTTVPTDRGMRYGLGLAALTLPCRTGWGHQGEFAGYVSYVLTSRDGARQVVILVNTFVEGEGQKAFQRLLTDAYCSP